MAKSNYTKHKIFGIGSGSGLSVWSELQANKLAAIVDLVCECLVGGEAAAILDQEWKKVRDNKI